VGVVKKLLFVLVLALAAPAAAGAHPLGNFTVNRFARVEVAGERLYARYVLDMAEIPAYEARQRGVDARVYSARIARGLHVTLDGRRVALTPVAHALAFPVGAGGLHTLRLEVILRGPAVTGSRTLVVRDTNYGDRIGWSEIVVGAGTRSVSGELRSYPRGLLDSPLDVTSAQAVVRPTGDAPPRVSSGRALRAPDRVVDPGFTRLIGRGDLSLLAVLASLVAALFWGAAHALSPGHGKTIVTAYLIGRRGTARDAVTLGAIVTVTHTIGVFALGLVTLALSQWIVPDRLYPWLNLAAGVSVVLIGVTVLRQRAHEWLHGHAHHRHDDDHRRGGLLAVGISGGILPCPSALVVLLAAISLHRIAFGLVLIVAFSAGLALAITAVGLAAVLARDRFARRRFDGVLLRALPAVSAAVIIAVGIAMTVRALPRVG
jgi:ABC-type nickel/cobalt efflux system permease component RcnA